MYGTAYERLTNNRRRVMRDQVAQSRSLHQPLDNLSDSERRTPADGEEESEDEFDDWDDNLEDEGTGE
jgi:hypothetical protein